MNLENLQKDKDGKVVSYSIGNTSNKGFTGKVMGLNGFDCYEERLIVNGSVVGEAEDEWDDCVAIFTEKVGLDAYSEIQNIEEARIDFNVINGKFVYSEVVKERML